MTDEDADKPEPARPHTWTARLFCEAMWVAIVGCVVASIWVDEDTTIRRLWATAIALLIAILLTAWAADGD
jgi:uncharacterized membrane protein YoaK (UPF0700 family)